MEFYSFVFFHHRKKKQEEDLMWCNVKLLTPCWWRWKWWCQSAAPSSSPQTSGGRLGTSAGLSVWTELRLPHCHPRKTGWAAPHPEISQTPATSESNDDDFQLTLTRNRTLMTKQSSVFCDGSIEILPFRRKNRLVKWALVELDL